MLLWTEVGGEWCEHFIPLWCLGILTREIIMGDSLPNLRVCVLTKKDPPTFVFCFGYFSSNNCVVSVVTFPKQGAITNKQATSSAVLFLLWFINELKKRALIYPPAWYVMKYFHQTLPLIELILISARWMQIHVLRGFWTVRWEILQLVLGSVDTTGGAEIFL